MHVDFMRQSGLELPVAARPSESTSLRIWHCDFKSFGALPSYEQLEELMIGSFPEPTLKVIAALPRLRYLRIVHLPAVKSLAPLQELLQLQCLSLATLPAWDAGGRRTNVEALLPLTGLRSLRHLELFGVCPPDRSLADLKSCSWIATARFSQYPIDQVKAFYAATGALNEFNPQAAFEG